jgi:hypothetical protein
MSFPIVAIASAIRKLPLLHKVIGKTRQRFYAIKRHLLIGREVVDCSPFLEKAITEKIPFAAGKIGSVEAAGLRAFLVRKKAQAAGEKSKGYGLLIGHWLFINAGVFPQSEKTFDRFGEVFLDAVMGCNALVCWDVAGEAEIFRAYCLRTILVKMRSLEPYFCATPWSRALECKRVLVVSPFATSIEKQYDHRNALWDDARILPAFKLMTLRAPLSAGLVPPESPDWFEALARMKEKMDGMDYDVALIGAGAFSLPLAVHAKRKGKVGIHMGGSLQILFGITGARWRENPDFKPFIKESWRRPSSEETPPGFKLTENGCYW